MMKYEGHTPIARITGPSSGNGTYDDGGDYALIDELGNIVGESFFMLDYGAFADAKVNAELWKDAPVLLELLRECLEILQAPQDYAYEQMYELAGKIEEAIE